MIVHKLDDLNKLVSVTRSLNWSPSAGFGPSAVESLQTPRFAVLFDDDQHQLDTRWKNDLR